MHASLLHDLLPYTPYVLLPLQSRTLPQKSQPQLNALHFATETAPVSYPAGLGR